MTVSVRLEPARLRPERELDSFMAHLDGDGALVSFVGIARPTDNQGKVVSGLYLDHYPGMTEATLQRIASDARGLFDVGSILVVHRAGAVDPGEPIVFTAVSSRHRRAAFEAADYLMDRLKTEAGFWKRQDGEAGSSWIEPTEQDRADRARWELKRAGNR